MFIINVDETVADREHKTLSEKLLQIIFLCTV